MSTEKNIAKHLLDIKAVFLKPNDPFTWASGIKAPIYCDNRLTLSYPEVRDDVEHAIAEIIKTHYPQCEAVMGTSTAGHRACRAGRSDSEPADGLCPFQRQGSWPHQSD